MRSRNHTTAFWRSRKWRAVLLPAALVLAAAFLAVPLLADDSAQPDNRRVVAIGDVHGDIEDFRTILRTAGLIDEADAWTGGNSILVQTGDLVERGTAVREVLDLVIELQKQAVEKGGLVIALLGNHETNNLLGYLDYQSTPPEVYARIFAGFTDEESEERRKRALKQWSKWRHRFPQCGTKPKPEWERDHPPGFVEYLEAIGADGPYGSWLRSLPTMVRIGETLFAHAGPSPWLASQGLDTIYSVNRAVTREIEAFDEMRRYLIEKDIILPFFTLNEIHCAVAEALVQATQASARGVPAKFQKPMTAADRERLAEIRQTLPNVDRSLTLRSEGPLWYRGYARLGESDTELIAGLLRAWQVRSMVVAHTPQKGEVRRRFGNIYLIDTGMSYGEKVGGQASALEIEAGERFTALYSDRATLLADLSADDVSPTQPASDWRVAAQSGRWLGPDETVLPFATAEDLLEFLRSAQIVSSEEVSSGINRPRKLLLRQYGIEAHAIFRHFESEERNKRLPSGEVIRFFSDSYRNEAAAWEVARLLGLNHVYPATQREVQGRKGSVQLWVEDAISERDRIARDIHPPGLDAWFNQAADMRVFDNLIGNFDRNQTNILVDPDWKVWFIDHTRSFGREQQIPDRQHLERCSEDLWNRIRSLDETLASERLAAHLSPPEIEAFFARRQRVIETFEQRIADLGFEQVLFNDGRPIAPEAMRLVDSDSLAPAQTLPGAPE